MDEISISQEDLKDIKEHVVEEVKFWNDIADGKARFIDPMSNYSENLYNLLEVMGLPQADNGTIEVWINHLSKVHGIEIIDDGDYRAHCTTCRELARNVSVTIAGYIERQFKSEVKI